MTKFDISSVTDNEAKPVLKTGSNMCECAECGEFFLGVAPFDRHLKNAGRGCRTPEEMRSIGMVAGPKYGVWSSGTSKRQHDSDNEE